MGEEPVLMDIRHGIAVITLNRPAAMNTLTARMIDRLGQCLASCDQDDDVRVVVLTGKGDAFCAGADLSGGGGAFDTQDDMTFSSCPLDTQPWQVRKPVIAACNGHAIGAGLTTALMCDMRVFAREGKYGLLQNRRGVVADNAVEYLLPRLVGFERAFELLVRGNRLSGEEAKAWGLAGRAVAADEVLSVATEIARDMVRNCSPLVMAMHKRMLWRALDLDLEHLIALETSALHYSMGREDAIEGGAAYLEKRPPNWRSSVSSDWPPFL